MFRVKVSPVHSIASNAEKKITKFRATEHWETTNSVKQKKRVE